MGIWFHKPAAPQTRSQFPSWIPTTGGGYAHVDGGQIDNAQQSVAIDAAVDLIASICSELPIDFYSGQGGTRREIKMPGWLEDPAGDGYGLEDWIYQLVYSWLYRGNGYGDEIARSSAGYLQQVALFHPDRVSGRMVGGDVVWLVQGQEFTGRMMHRRVNPVPGQIIGQSPISKHADTIGVTLAASRFGKDWFDADAQPVGILRNTLAGVDPEQAKTVKQRFMAALRGNREPVVMGRGWEWENLSVTPEESQFLGTMGYTEAQCARIYGPGIAEILGYDTGGSMTYANVQDRDIQLLKYAVGKWIRRVERTLFLFLPRPQYAKINRDALLETNTLARYQAYQLAMGKPWKSVNEVRELEDEPPVPGGNDVVPKPAPLLPAAPPADPNVPKEPPS
jgi:HK97 family phage portal protein